MLALEEFRYVDPNADENYDFATKDPEETKPIIFGGNQTARRFICTSSDEKVRIFNIESMRMEKVFNSRLL